MNINEIEVNGEKFGIESINDMYVGRQEPEGDVLPSFWYKPADVISIISKYGMERTLGSTNTRGNYTLDTNGQLVETTETTSNAPRTTTMFPLLKNNQYKLTIVNNSVYSDTLQFPFAVYFYDKNRNFISKSEFLTELGVTYNPGHVFLTITLPENARYVRLLIPYTYATSSYMRLVYGDITGQDYTDIANGITTNTAATWYYYDEDTYVEL